MTYPEFMTALQDYYGAYENEFKAKTIAEWVKKNYKEKELDWLIERITENHSGSYGRPDIATIKKYGVKSIYKEHGAIND
jgi:hypothetical protein